ncbi:cell envelope integrity protein CreD [Mucilaginibacter sp. BJC16-A38]|uniref:cell envelope integrity protein CreD n=1 Tax=Mucilaginibacter phenanthrenivorans TaxID=1234842 RepID=UPI002157D910|nr:cell envelope integrity protein CreD [Mucilaginibacter phenanthrenivorans]MCR8561271.1 cell envelope integrity protein CreD [Mucilaginibacter phenanthrenivorans]
MEQIEEKKGFMHWLKESVTVKLAFIGILTVVLLIPSSLVESLINERASRQDVMMQDVADKWSGSQEIKGPVLVIPYKKHVKYVNDKQQDAEKDVIENLYVLPDNLHIKADLKTQILHRGIFNVAVYNTIVKVSGNFTQADLNKLNLQPNQLIPEKARVAFSISDLKGLKTNPIINAADQSGQAEPIFDEQSPFVTGLQANINLSAVKPGEIPFDFSLDLKGSQELSFLPLGKTTDVEAKGDWASPSFDGRYLPDTRNVDSKGFLAKWKMLYYNRPYPQQWLGNDTLLSNEKKEADVSFGVKLLLPVDQYQKTTRTSKYSLLIIMLTFISLFLTEIIRKQKIHPFNYLLIGAAMIIYYSLLLSFSEQIGFNPAYLLASVATVVLITTFIGSLLKNRNAALLFGFILSVFYTFIFVIIQLEDFALMMGSVALFIIIGMLMYFSRRINWDKQ